MGSRILTFAVVLIGIGAMVFLNYPPPTPSPALDEWKQTGTNFTFKAYNIFFKTVTGQSTPKAAPSDKRVLLLIHGFPTSSFDWNAMLPDLRKRFDIIVAPDLIGLGFSDKPRYFGYPVSFQADMIEALMSHLQVTKSKIHIMAHDYGDTVAQELLARFNDNLLKFNIHSVALLNGGIFPRKHIATFSQRLLRTPVIGSVVSKFINYYVFSPSINIVFGSNKPTETELLDMWTQQRYLDGYLVMGELLTYIDQRLANEERWVGALVQYSVSKPIHLIAGPADPVNPLLCANFKKNVPNGSCDVLPDAIGHFPLMEDPSGVVKFYFDFLDENNL